MLQTNPFSSSVQLEKVFLCHSRDVNYSQICDTRSGGYGGSFNERISKTGGKETDCALGET